MLETIFYYQLYVNCGFFGHRTGLGTPLARLLEAEACRIDLGRGIALLPQLVFLVQIPTGFAGVEVGFPCFDSRRRGCAATRINIGRTDTHFLSRGKAVATTISEHRLTAGGILAHKNPGSSQLWCY